MMRKAWCKLMRHNHDHVYVRLLHHEGPPTLIGPMDRWTANFYIASRIVPTAMHGRRSVDSARIIGNE